MTYVDNEVNLKVIKLYNNENKIYYNNNIKIYN